MAEMTLDKALYVAELWSLPTRQGGATMAERALAVKESADTATAFEPDSPARTFAIGEQVEDSVDLDALPVGGLIRDADEHVIEKVAHPGKLWANLSINIRGGVHTVATPARILDLPGTTS